MNIISKKEMKEALKIDSQLTAKLCYKAEMVESLTDRIDGINLFSTESVGSREYLHNLRKQIQIEMLQVIGAIAGEYTKTTGKNLFSEFVNDKNYEKLTGEARIKTVGQMCQILRIADECCGEIWADYLENMESVLSRGR